MRRAFISTLLLLVSGSVYAEDWSRFRGPAGTGVSSATDVPTTWSETENLRWKTPMPGGGSSSPILVGDNVYLTCFSGNDRDLKRHLVCVKKSDGSIAWTKTIENKVSEDGYNGYITEHGYASNTPVSDGKRVFAFFGKSGVYAFDLKGDQLWHVNVGTESSNRRWGSGASLVLHGENVIVNASDESQSIRALNKETGKEAWKAEAGMLELAYGTPSIAKINDKETHLVLGVPGELWGLHADTGKLTWYAETTLTGNICPSVTVSDGIAYVFGGYRSSGSFAIRVGGNGDVTDENTVWDSRNSSYVATPLLHEGHLYWVDDRGQAFCSSAKTGELVYRERLRGVTGGGRPFYASPVLVENRLFVVSRYNGTFVFDAKPEFKQLAQNKFDDDSDFSGTPAVGKKEMYLRSNKFLYCVGK